MTLTKAHLIAALALTAAGALHAQTVSVDKTSLNFYAQSNGTAVSDTVNVTSTGGSATFGLLLSPQNSWLKVNPSQNTPTPATVTVTADPTGLVPNTYVGTITVFAPSMPQPYPTIQVTLVVGTIGITPASLSFVYQQGGPAPPSQTIALSGQATNFNASVVSNGGSWLAALPFSGVTPATVTASINASVLTTLPAGTYKGSVTITPTSGSVLTQIVIPVTLTVTSTPPVTVTPATISLNYQIGGLNNNSSQNVTLSTTGILPVSYSLTPTVDPNPSGAVWIQTTPISGAIPAAGSTTAAIGYDATKNLPASPNPYTGKVTVLTPGGTPTQQDVNVRLLVSAAPLLNVPGDTLTFSYQAGTAAPSPKMVTATTTQVPPSSATGQMTFTISATTNSGGGWLIVPGIGTTGSPFNIGANVTGLATGTYNGTVSLLGVGAGNGAQTIPVTLTVSNDSLVTASFGGCSAPSQACKLLFPAQIGQAAPAAQTIKVSSSTSTPLSYSATTTATTCGAAWLSLGGATTGSTDGTLTVTANPTGIADGTKCDGSVTIAGSNSTTGAASPNSPLVIPVTMYVSSTALLSVNPVALTFSSQLNGQTTPAQSVTINSTSPAEQLNYSVTWTPTTGNNSWLIFGPTQGSTAAGLNVVTVLAQPALLSPGVYTGNLTITATTASGGAVADSPITIPVSYTVIGSNLSVTPTSLSFTQPASGAQPPAQVVKIASDNQPIAWTASVSTGGTGNWLAISTPNGTTPTDLAVSTNASGLAPATYNGTITITATTPFAGGSPVIVNVQLVVPPGTLSTSVASLTFAQSQNGVAPPNQTFQVTSTPSSLGFTATATTNGGGTWLTVSPANGTTNAQVTVSVNGSALTPGQYTGTVTIASPGAASKQVSVTLTVVTAQTFTVAPATVSFSYILGTAAPAAQTVQLTSSGSPAPFSVTAATTSGGNWLTVTPVTGSTPAALTITANPTGLAAGAYAGTVTIASPYSATAAAATIAVNLTVAQIPPPVVTAIKSNASYAIGPIAAGENIVLGGTGLGPVTLVVAQVAAGASFPTTLSDTQVTFDGIPAPVYYSSATQTSVFVPYEVANRTTVQMRVIYKGIVSDPVALNVAAAAPGIYTQNSQGSGPGSILNQDYAINGSGAPAAKGAAVQVFMTGEGLTMPTPANGAVAPTTGSGLFKPTLPVTATVGGIPAEVQYYGSAPGLIYGVMQVNVKIPANAPSGASEILIKVGSFTTQSGVTVAVQ